MGSLRRFEGEEEEWLGGEEERKIVMASWRGCEKAWGEREGKGEEERKRERKEPVCCALLGCTYWSPTAERRVPAIGGEWWGGAQRARPRCPAGWACS